VRFNREHLGILAEGDASPHVSSIELQKSHGSSIGEVARILFESGKAQSKDFSTVTERKGNFDAKGKRYLP
jgi:hypothetical protein